MLHEDGLQEKNTRRDGGRNVLRASLRLRRDRRALHGGRFRGGGCCGGICRLEGDELGSALEALERRKILDLLGPLFRSRAYLALITNNPP